MVDDNQPETSDGRRTRTPGVQYPGASLPTVVSLLGLMEELGGRATVGRLAARVGKSEGTADFKRLIISARTYGLAEWDNDTKTVLRLTEDGQKVAKGEDREAVLRQAFLRPDVFRAAARSLAGRTIPDEEGLIEVFTITGVAPSGARLAAANFVASAEAAGAVEQEGTRRLMSAELPFPTEEEVASSRPSAAGTAASSKAAVAARSGGSNAARPAAPAPDKKVAPITQFNSGAVTVNIRLDVSEWDSDRVVDLVKRLRAV